MLGDTEYIQRMCIQVFPWKDEKRLLFRPAIWAACMLISWTGQKWAARKTGAHRFFLVDFRAFSSSNALPQSEEHIPWQLSTDVWKPTCSVNDSALCVFFFIWAFELMELPCKREHHHHHQRTEFYPPLDEPPHSVRWTPLLGTCSV